MPLLTVRRLRCSILDYFMYVFMIMAVLLLTSPNHGHAADGQFRVLSTPRDATINVGSTTDLTCIVGESSGPPTLEEEPTDMYWIITWDTTATVQRIQADKSGPITGLHYGIVADRGEYSIDYGTDVLTTTDSECAHVIHTSVLRIENATLRDAGIFACGNERQKGTLSIVEMTDDLDGCSLAIIIVGLIAVVGWCLAIVEFGFVMYMCLQKPQHAERRRKIVRRVSIMLPQSKRAAYEIRESKRADHRRRRARVARGEEEMVQQVPRLFDRDIKEEQLADDRRLALNSEERNALYVNVTLKKKERAYEQKKTQPKSNKLVTFNTSSNKKKKNKKPVRKGAPKGAPKRAPKGARHASGNTNGRNRRPESLAIVKPFGVGTDSQADEVTKLDLYMNYPSLERNKHAHQAEKYAESLDSSELVSTPL